MLLNCNASKILEVAGRLPEALRLFDKQCMSALQYLELEPGPNIDFPAFFTNSAGAFVCLETDAFNRDCRARLARVFTAAGVKDAEDALERGADEAVLQ